MRLLSLHNGSNYSRLVPLTGIEPVWYLYRGILSPLRLPIPPQRHVKLYGVCPSHCAPDAFTGVFKPRQRPFSARSCSLGTRDLKSPALCGSARAPERLRSPLSHPCAAGEGTCTLPTSCALRCGKYGSLLRKKHRLETMPFAWRRHPDLNRGVKVLQTFALPLGYGAKKTVRKVRLERETRLEPATFTLAR